MLSATTSTTPTNPWSSVAPVSDSSATQLSDACALLALLVRNQCSTQNASKTDVDVDFKELQALKQQLADSIQKAKDAADHSGFFGFLSSVFGSDVAQVAGAVAAIAAVVATGGAAAPLVMVALSLALEEGAKIGAKLGLDPKICMAISLAAAALGMACGTGATQASSTLVTVARDVKLGANLTQGAATAAGGTLGYVAGHYQAQQLGYQADATSDQAKNDATNMDFDSAIALLQSSLHTEQSETGTASAIVQNDSDTNTALSNRI